MTRTPRDERQSPIPLLAALDGESAQQGSEERHPVGVVGEFTFARRSASPAFAPTARPVSYT